MQQLNILLHIFYFFKENTKVSKLVAPIHPKLRLFVYTGDTLCLCWLRFQLNLDFIYFCFLREKVDFLPTAQNIG